MNIMGDHPAHTLMNRGASLPEIDSAASACTQCDLYKEATQTVFGQGPAGRILDEALAAAGIDPTQAYVTNVVKHFKFERRGKRRIHKRPYAEEIRACFPWLEAELDRVDPQIVVCLGATAAKALRRLTEDLTTASTLIGMTPRR